jgi:hypothetical protein
VADAPQREQLIDRIAALAASAQDPDYLERFNPESSRYQAARLVQVGGVSKEELDDLGREIARYFGLDPDLHTFVRSSPNGSGAWLSRLISGRLVARSRFADAGTVLAEYERAFTENAADVHEVVALWGLHLREPFEIRNGIHLVPLSSVPPSPPRDILLGIPTYADWREEEGAFHVRARPKAALTHSFRLSPVVSARRGSLPSSEPSLSRQGEMLEIARSLTLIVPRAVQQVGSWFQTDHPLVGGVGGWGGQAISSEYQFEVAPEDMDPTHVRGIVNEYFALPAGDRQNLRIVLDRLNIAKLRQTLEDRAVDLGVSLEALLFNPEDMPPGEISLKFKLRGSVLAADDPQERKAVVRLLDRVYSLRSTAAHGVSFEQNQYASIEAQGVVQSRVITA